VLSGPPSANQFVFQCVAVLTSAHHISVVLLSFQFSLPTPLSFTSGSQIPFTVGLTFPAQPHVSKLLSKCVRVGLYKRLSCSSGSPVPAAGRLGKDSSSLTSADAHREWLLASGELKFLNEYKEGLALLRGFVDAGEAGKECSWKLGDTAEATYVLRAMLVPPKNMQEHLPSFKFETQVELTTDVFGSLEREVASTGVSMPALGLVSCLPFL
jgi:hypothetical protein